MLNSGIYWYLYCTNGRVLVEFIAKSATGGCCVIFHIIVPLMGDNKRDLLSSAESPTV